MSEDSNRQSRSPAPKASTSSIFDAFRSFTGSKSKRTSIPSIAPITLTSPELEARPAPPSPERARLALQRANTISSSDPRANVSNEDFVGVPAELKKLVEKLDKKYDTYDRLHAAKQIPALIEQYPVPNVAAIWKRAEDLLYQDDYAAIGAAYNLLRACVKHKTLVARERVTFIEVIMNDDRELALHNRVRSLKELTLQGKYLDHVDVFIAPLCVKLLKQAYQESMDRRSKDKDKDTKKKNDKDDKKVPNRDYCEEVLQYILDIIKFNAKFLTEPDLASLVRAIVDIVWRTKIDSHRKLSMDIIDTIITYSQLPRSILRETLEVICAQYCHSGMMHDCAARTIRLILSNHYAVWAIADLLDLMNGTKSILDYNSGSSASLRGALLVLILIKNSPKEDNLKMPELSDLLAALSQALESGSRTIAMATMELLLAVITDSDYCQSLFAEKEWASFKAIVAKVTAREGAMSTKYGRDSGFAEKKVERWPHEQMMSLLQQVFNQLILMCGDSDLDHMSLIMDITRDYLEFLNDESCISLISYHVDERLLLPSSETWIMKCEKLHEAIFLDKKRPSDVRLNMLNTLYDAFNDADALSAPGADELVKILSADIKDEEDYTILEKLCTIVADVGTWTKDDSTFETVFTNMRSALFDKAIPADRPMSPDQVQNDERGMSGSRRNLIMANTMVRLFLRNLNRSGSRILTLWSSLIHLANSPSQPPDARIVAMKLIFRVRSDSNHAIYVVPETGCEDVAAALCRTTDSVIHALHTPSSPIVRPSRPGPDDQTTRRPNQSTPAAPHSTRANQVTRSATSTSGLARMPKANHPLWMYGNAKGLPEDPPARSSHLVFSHIDAANKSENSNAPRVVLPVRIWLDLVVSMLQRKDLEWETYSYMIVHLGAQLSNRSLFVESFGRVMDLTNLLIRQLKQTLYHAPPVHTNLKKADVAICLYHVLTVLISYKEYLHKWHNDIVITFMNGIGSQERTSEVCMHALSICCHELPMPVTKILEALIPKFGTVITQSHLAVHILEFLAGLARLPDLFSNFRDSDYTNVFSICIRYLEYVRDQKNKQNRFSARSSRASLQPARTGTPPLPEAKIARSLADELPQYVYALAYHVIVFWFLALRLRDRPHHMEMIQRKLMFRDEHGKDTMDEQGQVTMDFLHRIAYSDSDDTAAVPDFAKAKDGTVAKKSWIVGNSIMTVETAGRSGISQVTRRRPSGTRYSIFTPSLTRPPRHQTPIAAGVNTEAFFAREYVGVTPDDILADFYSPMQIVYDRPIDIPIPLPDDESTQRTINTFDRIPALDGHKIGVIYVGEDQHDEVTILSNVMGSEDYTSFLNGIGTLIELKGATFNTQGLDREFDTDGKFAFCWRNRVTEIVFHVTTMMPTNLDHDPQCSLKKRHTGNDFVNIIWNNSGGPFDFNTFPSDFNYVNIVITPEARTSFVATRLHASASSQDVQTWDGPSPDEIATEDLPALPHPSAAPMTPLYRVTVLTAPSIPAISPAATTKVVSGASLPIFVRLLALNASVFCGVWSTREQGGVGEHVSSWRSRLREINRLKERFGGSVPDRPKTVGATGSGEFDAGSASRERSGVREVSVSSTGTGNSGGLYSTWRESIGAATTGRRASRQASEPTDVSEAESGH